jgi:hypothetical protein
LAPLESESNPLAAAAEVADADVDAKDDVDDDDAVDRTADADADADADAIADATAAGFDRVEATEEFPLLSFR